MKTKFFAACAIACALLFNHSMHAQSSSANNNPGFNKYLGYEGAQNLEFRTNNIPRMVMMQNGNSTINGFNVNRSGFLGLSQEPTFFGLGVASPFSLLHLNGDNGIIGPQQLGYRDWMRYGIIYTHNNDLMYVGPRRVDSTDVTDAVIAWADNTITSANGPDNLTFIFMSGNGNGTGASSPGGAEVARMTANAMTGIGNGFSNALQPLRNLHTYRSNAPQFRIAQSLNEDIELGNKADFQTSSIGNLHIRTSRDTSLRTVAIGFLPGEQSNPINNEDLQTSLDVGGLTRIRLLPDSVPDCIITGYNIDSASPEDNFLTRLNFPTGSNADCLVLNGLGEWIDVCDLGSGEDFDWRYNSANNLDVVTGLPFDTLYSRRNVGIGIDKPNAKLHVENYLEDPFNLPTSLTGSTSIYALNGSQGLDFGYGVNVVMISDNNTNIGVNSSLIGAPAADYHAAGKFLVRGSGKYIYGVDSEVINSSDVSVIEMAAVKGVATNEATNVQFQYGVYGEVTNCDADFSAGIYGRGNINDNQPSCWAGYFDGPVFSTIGYFPSDEALKTNITDIESPSELLSGLQPKSYEFLQLPQINLPGGTRFGLLAQDVEEILPNLVTQVATPGRIDTLGNVVAEPLEFKAINYIELIPLLVGAINEQKGMIDAQQQQIADQQAMLNTMQTALDATIATMQDQLNATQLDMQQAKTNMEKCCQQNTTGSTTPDVEKMRLEQNVPNPFTNTTRIDFTLPDDAQVVLEISDSQGRKLDKLIDGHMAAGTHAATWDGSGYSPGMYYYSLYANGQLLTKKMIKR